MSHIYQVIKHISETKRVVDREEHVGNGTHAEWQERIRQHADYMEYQPWSKDTVTGETQPELWGTYIWDEQEFLISGAALKHMLEIADSVAPLSEGEERLYQLADYAATNMLEVAIY